MKDIHISLLWILSSGSGIREYDEASRYRYFGKRAWRICGYIGLAAQHLQGRGGNQRLRRQLVTKFIPAVPLSPN